MHEHAWRDEPITVKLFSELLPEEGSGDGGVCVCARVRVCVSSMAASKTKPLHLII